MIAPDMATIHDVAAHAGVSVATVSRVLNNHASVNTEMAERVRASISELQYRPSHVARSMRTQRTSIVAVVVPDVENPFFTAVVRGIEDVARTAGLLAVLCNSDDQPEAEMRYLRLVEDQRVDGVILASSMSAAPEELVQSGKDLPPLVLIDREVPGIKADVVLVDNETGARDATLHLLDGGATSARPARGRR
jgi:LacI family transcriptional regulator